VKTVLLFSGQGSHHFQMGRELFECDAVFRAAMLQADDVFRERCGESIVAMLFDERHARGAPFDRLLHSHAAIFMVEHALATTLVDAGITPDMVLGTSLGTFAAAAVAGHIDPGDALLAVIEQAMAVETHCQRGCMIAMMGDWQRCLAPELLALCELAAVNFDAHAVLSLPHSHAAQVESHLRRFGMTLQTLPVGYAFHSRWIDAAGPSYQAFLRTLALRQGSVPLVCCAQGKPLQALSADHFWSVVREPIRFQHAVEELAAHDDCRYIDVGPGGTLATFLKYALPAGSASSIHYVMSPLGSDMQRLAGVKASYRPAARGINQAFHPVIPADQGKHIQDGRSMESRTMKAIVFPGQGSQFKGMGKDLFPLFPEQVACASDILGYSLEELCLHDPQGLLSQTQYTQPALYVVNALHYLHRPERADFFAGHSLGEYNALLAAGVFSFETGLRLVNKRGELMGAASGGGMAAVLGIAAQEVRAMLDQHGLDQIDIANINSPTQTVIAGRKDKLAEAAELFAKKNLRCVMLNVSAAFHSRHMRAAQAEFAGFLQSFTFAPPQVTVIANATARPYDSARIAETLAAQIASPVQWVDSIRYVLGRGEVEFHEIGASVLSKMVQEIKVKTTPIVENAVEQAAVVLPLKSMEHEPPTAGTSSDISHLAGRRDGEPRVLATSLGSDVFRRRFGLEYAYMAGGMYRGVASAELVITMGKAGFLSFFGAGGLSTAKIEANIVRIQGELNAGQPYGMNLLANYDYPAEEDAVVDLYLKYGIRNVEAAAFMQMTPALVRFRLQGLRTDARNRVVCDHRIIAKVSRPEVAKAFMSPPPAMIVERLLQRGLVTPQQAKLAQRVPMSHDICVEADSGGHTDGGIAAVMLPPLLRMRDEMQRMHGYEEPLCMGLAGGIGGPEAAAAAFLLGADFILTGSVNQCTVEAGMSADGKSMLQEMDIHDTEYAPAGDMFELGAQIQVMKKSVFFPARANKLFSLYRHYDSLDDIPERTRRQLEGTFFKKTFEEIWGETAAYFRSVNREHEIAKAEANAKHKMALVFRWYFAYSSRIAMEGEGSDRVNYQIHTGPALGSFNQWVKGTELEHWSKRHVDRIAIKIMDAAAEHLARSYARFLGVRENRAERADAVHAASHSLVA
jgi:trans-AT polyketide synthase/acyltransferase/oxidoreductase domain-containing protein